jgi:hypothetical protein
MTKTPTQWSGNPSAEADEYPYNSATYTYNSTTQNYSGVVEGDMADSEKTPTEWEAS